MGIDFLAKAFDLSLVLKIETSAAYQRRKGAAGMQPVQAQT
jgi:hypothetical protein